MSITPAIAVVIPIFNGEQYINKAVESINKQTLQPSEVVIVNDGSTDNTSYILQSLSVANLRVLEQENKGVAVARNSGVKATQSEVLVFMDVDDFWHPQKLELQVKELISREYGLLYTDVIRISESETKIVEPSLILNSKLRSTKTMPIGSIIYKPHLTTSSVMVMREAFEAVGGFDEAFKTAEDQVFYMDIATQYKVGKIDLPLTYKRVVKNSLSSGITTYTDSLKALDRFELRHPSYAKQYLGAIRKARARIYRDLGSELLWERNTSKALEPLLMSMKKSPSIESIILLMKYVYLSIFLLKEPKDSN